MASPRELSVGSSNFEPAPSLLYSPEMDNPVMDGTEMDSAEMDIPDLDNPDLDNTE